MRPPMRCRSLRWPAPGARGGQVAVGLVGLGLLAATVAVVDLAEGQASATPPPTAELLYVRGAGAERCPDEAALRGAVVARLGYDPFSDAAAYTVRVSVSAPAPGAPRRGAAALVARIELGDGGGEVSGRRELSSPRSDCRELAQAMALAVALAIDPFGTVKPGAASGVEAPATPDGGADAPSTFVPPPVEPPPLVEPGKTPPRILSAAGEPLRVRLGLAPTLALGTGPSVASAGLALQLGFRKSNWAVLIEARGEVPGSAPWGGGTISSTLASGLLAGCVQGPVGRPTRARRVELYGCGVLAVGAEVGWSSDFASAGSGVAPYAALGGRVGAELAITRHLAVTLAGDLLFPLTPVVLELRVNGQTQPAWSTPFVGGDLAAMLLYYVK